MKNLVYLMHFWKVCKYYGKNNTGIYRIGLNIFYYLVKFSFKCLIMLVF